MKKILIIVSEFNSEVTSSLLEGAKSVLEKAQCAFEVEFVPGAYELAQLAAVGVKTQRYAGVIALGCVIRGETPHFDYVCQQAAAGLMQVSIENQLPVSFGVLTTDTVAQARARSGLSKDQKQQDGKQLVENKGEDAAQVVLSMMKSMARLQEGVQL
ncbi:MAG: 6,7-dimethyl-8-ribityllumazine synthase [Oligoflexales bacterium]